MDGNLNLVVCIHNYTKQTVTKDNSDREFRIKSIKIKYFINF